MPDNTDWFQGFGDDSGILTPEEGIRIIQMINARIIPHVKMKAERWSSLSSIEYLRVQAARELKDSHLWSPKYRRVREHLAESITEWVLNQKP